MDIEGMFADLEDAEATTEAGTESEEAQAEEAKGQPEAEQQTDEQQAQTEEAATPADTAAGLTVKFNREVRDLSHEDAVRYAQLGMLYEQEDAKETLEWLKNAAKSAGYSNVAEYRKAVQDQIQSNKAAELADERDIPVEVAEELLNQKAELEKMRQAQETKTKDEENRQKLIAEAKQFSERYPDVDMGKLPQEVLISKGRAPDVPLVYHYAMYEANQLRTSAEVKQKQAENESTATGSMNTGTPDNTSEEDALINDIFS